MPTDLREKAKDVLRKTGLFHPLRDLSRALSPEQRRIYRNQVEFHREFIREGSLCFDIGGHYGFKTGIFAALGARVVVVDPNPICLEGLKYHHGSNPSVTIVPKAVSDSVGMATFFVNQSAQVSSLRDDWFAGAWAPQVAREVPTTTLDELISQYGVPDFCKVDVEGCELQVFRGLSHCIPVIAFEFTGHELDLTRECLEQLAKVGTLACNASLTEYEMSIVFPDWTDPNTLIERLRTHPDAPKGDVFVRMT